MNDKSPKTWLFKKSGQFANGDVKCAVYSGEKLIGKSEYMACVEYVLEKSTDDSEIYIERNEDGSEITQTVGDLRRSAA